MLKNLAYNKKCYLLLTGFFLFLVLGYRYSFADSFLIANEIEEKERKLEWLKEKQQELPQLKQKMAEFEKVYSRNDSISERDKLTSYISEFADRNNCIVTEIPVKSSYKNDNIRVQTNTFTIKGSYSALVTLLHQLEYEHKYLSKIMSARFYSHRDVHTKKKNLYLTLIAQSFEQKNR